MEGRIGAPKRRVLCPRRFRDEEDWAMFRSSGTKRKVTFLSTGEGSRRRQKLMDGSIGGRRGKRSIAEDCDEGSVQEEEGAGNPGEEVSRDLDDVTSAGRGREAAESPGDTAKSAHNPAESPIRSVMPQPSPREPTTLPTTTNDLGSAALGANPSPLPPPHGNPNNPAPKGAEGDGAANFPRSTRTPRGPGRRAVPGQARGGKAKNKIRPRVQTASTSSSFQYPPSPEHNRTATTRGHWEEEEADDAEWGREPVPTLPRQRSLFPRGGGNSRPGRAGEYSFLRVPNHRGLPRRPWGDNHWERDDSCYVVGGYYDDYVDDYDTVDVFPSSSQKYRQRRPESRMCYVNDGVPSFYFRNREEEDSWFQWRKERELRRQEEEGSSRGPEGEGRASASADGRTTQKKEEVPGRTVAATARGNTTCNILIIGHSFIFWASRHAAGKQLVLPEEHMRIAGQGWRGMKWEQLRGRLSRTMLNFSFIHLIIVHAGGNDLTSIKTPALIEKMRKDLEEVIADSRVGGVAWSDIIQRGDWRGAISPQGIEKSRKKVNQAMHKLMCSSGNGVIKHNNIKHRQTQLFRKDKVHLSEEGLDLFWENIRNFIEGWWRSRQG
eukprot:XP_012809050.1 PREDICTED: uncharacterized protein LOC105945479 isoform X3 [Xenopus tropicalis]